MTGQAVRNGVIVADNEALMRDVIRSVLASANQEVFPAADGVEAVELARRFKARLVILDIKMPRLNGLEACQQIRALPGYADVPIVMLTGHSEEIVVNFARKIGVNDFIAKPFRPNALLARLAPYLDTRSGGAAGVTPLRPGAELGAKAEVWKREHNLDRFAEEEARLANGREVMRVWRGATGDSQSGA
jgi:DNA-binding response OmpR family regulator